MGGTPSDRCASSPPLAAGLPARRVHAAASPTGPALTHACTEASCICVHSSMAHTQIRPPPTTGGRQAWLSVCWIARQYWLTCAPNLRLSPCPRNIGTCSLCGVTGLCTSSPTDFHPEAMGSSVLHNVTGRMRELREISRLHVVSCQPAQTAVSTHLPPQPGHHCLLMRPGRSVGIAPRQDGCAPSPSHL